MYIILNIALNDIFAYHFHYFRESIISSHVKDNQSVLIFILIYD